MKKRFFIILSALVIFSVLVGACAQATPSAEPTQAEVTAPTQETSASSGAEPTQETATGASGKPIVLGLPAIQTGADTYIHGELIIKASQFAADEINARGGVLGRPLEFLVMDDAGDPKQGVNVAHAFCGNPDVVAVLGHTYSGVTIPALPVYNECRLPIIVHGTNPKITELGFDNVVQNTPNDLITGQAAADHAKNELGIKSVAIIHNKSMWGAAVATVFKTRCEEIGITVTSYQGVDPEDVDFTPVLTKVKGENPDAVYFAGYTEQGLMRKQMVQLGMTQKWLAAEATSSEYIDITGETGIGTISATAAPPLDFRQEMIDFANRFQAAYGKLPESWSSYYYDMVYAIADAITKANSDKREDIIQFLKKIDVPSIIYPDGLQFDSSGRVVHPVTFIYELGSDLKYKTIYVWQGVPPYQTMSEEEYKNLIESLK